MSTSFIQRGDVMTYTAPAGGVTAGLPLLIGALLVVPQETVAAGLPFDGYVTGVVTGPKVNTEAWTEGQSIYWAAGTSKFTTTATANYYAGVAAAAAAAADATGQVRLNGIGIKAAG